jgi:hypothetical protein
MVILGLWTLVFCLVRTAGCGLFGPVDPVWFWNSCMAPVVPDLWIRGGFGLWIHGGLGLLILRIRDLLNSRPVDPS